jgi:GDPmannose 4,6-dehydratase
MLNQNSPKEYLLSSNQTHSVREFIELAFKEVGIDADWDFVNGNTPEHEEFLYPVGDGIATLVRINPEFYRPAEVDLLWGNSQKARNELNWQPKISFNELVKRMVNQDINLAI